MAVTRIQHPYDRLTIDPAHFQTELTPVYRSMPATFPILKKELLELVANLYIFDSLKDFGVNA